MIPTTFSHRCEVVDELANVWDRVREVIAVLVEVQVIDMWAGMLIDLVADIITSVVSVIGVGVFADMITDLEFTMSA